MSCLCKWKLGLQPAVPWWFNFDPHPDGNQQLIYPPSPLLPVPEPIAEGAIRGGGDGGVVCIWEVFFAFDCGG